MSAYIPFSTTRAFAEEQDRIDPLRRFRERFHIPTDNAGKEILYFCGNSLGLQLDNVEKEINAVLSNWRKRGVEGHFTGSPSWIEYNESLKPDLSSIVGAKPSEVAIMNTLSVNLHLLLASFYKPEGKRCKILIEKDAFPSDKYVVSSHVKWHGLDPDLTILELSAQDGSDIIAPSDVDAILGMHRDEIAVIMIGGVNYYTGQVLDMEYITKTGQEHGCIVGFDLAHGVGNIPLQLHSWEVDFAAWCHYKYLNAGPGAIAGAFVHQRHHKSDLPRLEGWWGNNLQTRFLMEDDFDPASGAEAWVMSTPPTLAIAPLKASLEIFSEAGFENCRKKSRHLTGYLEYLIEELKNSAIEIVTPKNPDSRGCQLSVRVKGSDKSFFNRIHAEGVEVDWREPDVIRVSPAPLYNSYQDVWKFVEIFKKQLALM